MEYKFLKFLDKIVPVIKPNQKSKLIWDFIIILIIMMYFFVLPMQLSFDFFWDLEFEDFCDKQHIDHTLSKFIVFIPEIILITDTFLKLFSGYYENGIIVTNKKNIIEHYLKKGLFFDLLAYLPILTHGFLIQYINGTIIKLIQMLMFCKLKRVSIALSNFHEIISSRGRNDHFLSAVRLLLTLLVITNFNACLWHGVAYFSSEEHSWLIENNLIHSSWQKKYIVSLFWAISLFGGIGVGDKIFPQNNSEYIIGNCLVFFSIYVFGYTLYSVFVIFKAMSKEQKEYQ